MFAIAGSGGSIRKTLNHKGHESHEGKAASIILVQLRVLCGLRFFAVIAPTHVRVHRLNRNNLHSASTSKVFHTGNLYRYFLLPPQLFTFDCTI